MDATQLKKRQRKADQKIFAAAEALGKKFLIPNATAVGEVLEKNPEVAQVKRMEAVADLLEAVCSAHGLALPATTADADAA